MAVAPSDYKMIQGGDSASSICAHTTSRLSLATWMLFKKYLLSKTEIGAVKLVSSGVLD